MMIERRKILKSMGAAGVVFAARHPALAQTKYPAAPIRIIVPYPAGGPYDGIPRVIGEFWSKRRGWPVVVENRAGGSGVVGIVTAKNAPADGHTLVISTASTHASGPAISPKLSYDPLQDLEQIVLLGEAPLALLVRPDLPVTTIEDLLTLIRKSEGKLNYASGGFASQHHLATSMMLFRASLPQTAAAHVPFQGLAPALQALLAGHVDFMFTSTGAAAPFIESGALRPLAVSSRSRSDFLPAVPTLHELGFAGFHIVPWCGLAAPRGTPTVILETLNRAANEALQDPEVRKRISNLDYLVRGGTRSDFDAWIRTEIKQYVTLVDSAGLKVK